MMSTTPLRFLVRDGTEDDISACLSLDSRYETNFVLRVYLHGQEATGWEISLQRERLPRAVELSHSIHRAHLRDALEAEDCYLVAVNRDDDQVLGCLVMRPDPLHGFALIQGLVVSPHARRRQIGTRLIAASGIWAREHGVNRLMTELSTKNVPGIAFLESLGFTFCGFNDRYFSDENIAVFFNLPLK